MCGSSNPYAEDSVVKWMCAACSYNNAEGSSSCRMCGIPMAVRPLFTDPLPVSTPAVYFLPACAAAATALTSMGLPAIALPVSC